MAPKRAFSLMNHHKLNNKQIKSTQRAHPRNRKSKNPTKHTVQHNDGSYTDSSDTRCHATISLILYKASGDIYINHKGNLQNCNHLRECPDNTNCNEGDLGSDNLNLLKVL